MRKSTNIVKASRLNYADGVWDFLICQNEKKKKPKTKKLSSFEVFDAVESRGFLRK